MRGGNDLRGLSAEERLKRCSRVMDSGCWEWTAYVLASGYGSISIDGKTWRAHRLAYATWVGPIPDGAEIDHMCHNRLCINPGHLRAVTRIENMQNRKGASKHSRTGVRGVHWNGSSYTASLQKNGEKFWLGSFATIEEATEVVERARAEMGFYMTSLDELNEGKQQS